MANSAKVGSPSFDKYVKTMGNNVGEIAAVEGKTKMQGGLDEENTRDAALIASRAISLKVAKDSERTAEGIKLLPNVERKLSQLGIVTRAE